MKLILSFLLLTSAAADISDIFSDDYINHINEQNLTWKAGRFFDKSMTLVQVQKLLGALSSEKKLKGLSVRYHNSDDKEIPDTFDARENWPKCDSIKMVRDQANCGSCWAFAAVEAMSDRICIHSNDNNDQTLVSAEDLLSCCGTKCGDGCDGGYPAAAWEYWYTNGLVSGGLNGDTEGCKAYSLAPCNHHVKKGTDCSTLDDAATPQCTTTCDNSTLDYKSQKTFGSEPYALSSLEKDIQIEIMTNGPVEASFDVYPSFITYNEGVYQKTETEKSIGGHAVKIIGWGTEKEKNTTYWLIANSWNENWGEKGFFKMLRGENHCGIESNIVAGLPVSSSGSSVFPKIGVITLILLVFSHL